MYVHVHGACVVTDTGGVDDEKTYLENVRKCLPWKEPRDDSQEQTDSTDGHVKVLIIVLRDTCIEQASICLAV